LAVTELKMSPNVRGRASKVGFTTSLMIKVFCR
jgi:hypothetical protein